MTMNTIRTSLTSYRVTRNTLSFASAFFAPVFFAGILVVGLLLNGGAVNANPARPEILGLKSSSAKAVTTLRIQGTSKPTFTVYKLENPSRIVVDVVGTTLSSKLLRDESKVVWNVNSWAVAQVSAHSISKARGQSVRVVVGLSRASRYSVRASGKDVLVEVVAKEAPSKNISGPSGPSGSMDTAALERARVENEKARKAAIAELAQARSEAKRIRGEAARRGREAKARIAQANQIMALAKTRSAQAEAASRTAKGEIALAKKQQASAKSAQASAVLSRAALKKAERAALLAKSLANKAKASNAGNRKRLQARAKAAGRAAEKRRTQAEAALNLAERRRIASEKARRLADQQRIVAAKALSEAQAERKRAEAQRDRAIAVSGTASSKRREAEVTARAAAERAKELQGLVRAEEARLASAKNLRVQEEKAMREARQARTQAERHRAEAVTAQGKLSVEIKRLSTAKQQARRSRITAEKALARAEQAAADGAVSLQVRKKLDAQAKSLILARARAEKELTIQEQSIQSSRAEVAALKATRAAAVRGLTSLEREVNRARSRRTSEEAKLAALSGRRAKVQARLDEARGMRLAAKAELESARRARAQAEVLRQSAEQQRILAQRNRNEAEQQRALAQGQREKAEALRTVAQRNLSETERQRSLAQGQREKAEALHRLAKTNLERATADRREAKSARLAAVNSKRAAESDRIAASKLALDAKRAQMRALAAETQVQRELDLAKRARLAAQSARNSSSLDMQEAKNHELAAERRLKELQRARKAAQRDRNAGAKAIAKSKAHERAALAALKDARVERLAAERVRAQGEAALKLASKREKAAKKLALASKVAVPVVRPQRPSTRLSDLDVVQTQGLSRVVIAMSSPAKPRVVLNRGHEAVIEIPNAAIRDDQERTLDTSSLKGAVKAVSSYRDPKNPNTLKIVVDLREPSKGVLKKLGNTYYWEFSEAKKSATSVASDRKRRRGARSVSYQTQAVAGYGSASSPITQQTVAQLKNRRRKVYRGQKMDLDFKNSDIHDLLRMLADVGGVNIIVPDSVTATVTIRLRRVPWDQAMDVILASKGLGYKLEGPGLYRIANLKDLQIEFDAKVARAKAMANREKPSSEILNLNYVTASDLQGQLESMLSRKGDLQIDERSNAIIVSDIESRREAIIEMAKKLDTQTPQIQIEARIVEARSTYIRQFGIQWGGNMSASAATGNATGLIFPSSIGLAGAAQDALAPTTGLGASPSDFAVNLPAAIGTGSGGGIGLSLGSIGGALGLSLRLSALEDEGSVRIVSSPKITTSNNVEATIKSGVSIPISVVSANGVSTQFVAADLELKVKPSVSLRDCAVSMVINVKKNEADFVNTGARGDPTILTKDIKTTILVQDGDTSVIGGIYTRNSGVSYSKVPFFGDLPVIGWLFKTTRENDERAEVLIFITPKITNRAFLPCQEK